MAQYLPFAMQQLFNTPLMMHQGTADMIVSALSGRLNISSLVSDERELYARDMRDLADMGRLEAKQAKAKKKKSMGATDATDQGDTFSRAGNIAVIPVQGVLKQRWGVGPYSGATGYDGIATMLMDAMDDETIDAIWFDIASGGGAVDGLYNLTDMIEASGEKLNGKGNGKPIWAMAADRAYSAAFAIGAAADKLIVPPTGGTGSVGVITMLADVTKSLENEGIAVEVVRYPAKKALSSGPEPIDDFTRGQVQAQVQQVAEMFQEMIARNMRLSKKSVAATEGLDYMGAEAKAIGFATDVMSEAQAWAKLQRKVA